MTKDLSIPPEIHIVVEHGHVYLIPPAAPIVRLNRSGSTIWACLDSSETIAEAAESFSVRARCAPSEAMSTVLDFVTQLVKSGILVRLP